MTVPEENRPKTTSTNDIIATREEGAAAEQDKGATGRTMGEALEEAGLSPDDLRDET
ncbi:hypothetical protein ACIOKD_18725 [Streptomyces sp. NPDC087844]|uniref:hypothetical protein n=1 Tax=Streptomyces sp. NPDC087844 TaxID=3365805 RepID=UPI0038094CB5